MSFKEKEENDVHYVYTESMVNEGLFLLVEVVFLYSDLSIVAEGSDKDDESEHASDDLSGEVVVTSAIEIGDSTGIPLILH